MGKPSRQDIEERDARALEWKAFRREFLFSQQNLADVLDCSRRSIVSIERGETVRPHASLLLRFRNLKVRHEREQQRVSEKWVA